MQIHCRPTRYKKLPPSHRHFAPLLAQGTNILTCEIWLRPVHTPVKFYPDLLRFAGVIRHIIPSRYIESVCTVGSYADKNINYCWLEQIYMHDSVGLQLGTSLQQAAKLQLANLLQNCYFCLIQKTISNSILWSLVIKYFWPGCFAPLTCCARGQLPPSAPPLLRHW